MDRYTLENKRVVIIGGSSGIGLATAIQAAEAGASIVIAGRSSSRLEAARNQIEMVRGDRDRRAVVETYVLDNQDEQQIETFFTQVGTFDHLFTPGAAYTRGPLTSDRMIAESCFKGKFWPQYFAAKYAVPYLASSGSIILMSGGFSQRPLDGGASYAACNGAIESLGKALAVELAPVRVNVVSPGTIWREGQEGTPRGDHFKDYEKMSVLKRVGSNEEIAHTVTYLMTNTFTTGSTLHVDGGYTLI
ncbi:SDR family oxidoreductase [Paenibacillus silvae]|uniref:Dehydrogenase n=1 Tax=Paenibacillus silvae TaxID=1325358 RepID=A0A2W6P6P7_9BACL|nr:SDR family oxidoreductase [Paenibacillus silvae]MCK6078808.1 SDR family oxidoreductase [Paenibacillus silvae]MCK6153127.1 SDR family oxidoreductase [Paenibacillus silvae]MCK6271638.1 SDR family oxidoreductase [Paenibacillus silvae]PZT53786.1 dehydrogenase [Paenibacillus silvae]